MFDRIFLAHPRRCGQGYFEHLGIALSFAGSILTDAAAIIIHAFVPAVLEQRSFDAVDRYIVGPADRRLI